MTSGYITILLVEDNPGDADLVRERLEETTSARFRVRHAKQLGAALQLFGKEVFDVILLDLSLPDVQGLDTVRSVRAACADVPVVVLTGLQDEGVGLEAIREGAQDYLVKDQIDGPLLARALRYAMERKRAEEALRQAEG